MEGMDHGFIPGEVTYVPERQGQPSMRPAHEINPGFMNPLQLKQSEIRERIFTAFHTKTFKPFLLLEDRERTATEIMERKVEGLNGLVKWYINNQRGVQRPFIDRLFSIAVKQGMLRPAPPDLQGHELEYQYNGILAQAQKMSKVQPIERLLAFAGQIGQVDRSVFNKVNLQQAMDVYGTALSVDATVMRSDEEADAISREQAKQAQAQQMATMVPALSKSAKDLSEAKLEEGSVLSKLAGAA